jgi:hypothetical protein
MAMRYALLQYAPTMDRGWANDQPPHDVSGSTKTEEELRVGSLMWDVDANNFDDGHYVYVCREEDGSLRVVKEFVVETTTKKRTLVIR